MTKRKVAVVVGLLVSAVFLFLALRRIDARVVWQTLATSHWWPWYVLAPSVYLVGLLMRGLRCREILKPHCDLPVATSTNIVVIGYAANNVLPARLGEVARAYVLSRKANLTVSLSLAVTFLERIFDGMTITLLLLAAAMYSPLPEWGREVLFAAGGIFAVAVSGVVLVMVAKNAVLALAKRMTSFLPERISERILSILDRAIAATDCLRDPRLAAKVALLSLLVWMIEGTVYMLILPAFDLPLNPIWAVMAMCVTNLGILVPSSPGYVGPFQYFCMQALGIFGVPSETGFGFAVMAFFLTYVPVTTWGLAAIAYYRIDLGTATHGGDDDGSLSAPELTSERRVAANR